LVADQQSDERVGVTIHRNVERYHLMKQNQRMYNFERGRRSEGKKKIKQQTKRGRKGRMLDTDVNESRDKVSDGSYYAV